MLRLISEEKEPNMLKLQSSKRPVRGSSEKYYCIWMTFIFFLPKTMVSIVLENWFVSFVLTGYQLGKLAYNFLKTYTSLSSNNGVTVLTNKIQVPDLTLNIDWSTRNLTPKPNF